jgi:hypothetical protein
MLCLDDYFMVESEKMLMDPEVGRMVKRRVSTMFIENTTSSNRSSGDSEIGYAPFYRERNFCKQ